MKPMYAPLLLLTLCCFGLMPQARGTSYAFSQTTIACNDTVMVSVDAACLALITPDDLIEGQLNDPADYSILIESGLNEIPNPIPADYLGETLIATITYTPTGNSCWSTVITEDKLGPEIICPVDTVQLFCYDDLSIVPPPAADDNCGSATLQLTNQSLADEDICDQNDLLVVRIWDAFDESGNTATTPCKQYIRLTRPNEYDFPNDIIWSCVQLDDYPDIILPENLHPAVQDLEEGTAPIDASGVTDPVVLGNTGSGSIFHLEAPACNLSVSYVDQIVENCGPNFDIIRTWTLIDWCTGQVIIENGEGEDNVQIIKIMDVTPPEMVIANSISIPVDTSTVCLSQAALPLPQVTEDCSGYTVRIYTSIGEAVYDNGNDAADGASLPPPGLAPGTHTLLYQATSECGLITEQEVELVIFDPVSPVVFCDEITEVTLNNEGLAEVLAEVFDDGTYDNCCLDEFLVRRMDSTCDGDDLNFGPSVQFCCADIDNSPIMVAFRAEDCYDNANECMVQVYVEDKLPVQMTNCPADLTITCHVYNDELAQSLNLGDFSVLDQFGSASFSDNCAFTETYMVDFQVNVCGYGYIDRTWIAMDDYGNSPASCLQKIEVRHVSDWGISFPTDLVAQCTDTELPEFGEPTVFQEDCELIGISYEDQVFTVVDDACYKIVRTWAAINWCIYELYGSDLYEELTEIEANQDFDGDGDLDANTFFDGINDGPEPDGYITFKQSIKVVDEEPAVLSIEDQTYCIVDTDCDTDILVPGPDISDCSEEFEINLVTNLPNYQGGGEFHDVPLGVYSIIYEVWDECGNFSAIEQAIEVIDCKLPTPICITGADIVLSQDGTLELSAETFNAGSYDNCAGPLYYSYSSDITDSLLWLDCDSLGQINVTIWVTDQYGNQDFCETFFFLFDNAANACVALPRVSGLVYSSTEEPMEAVEILVNAESIVFTDEDGYYTMELDYGGDFSILPYYEDDPLNGVTTFDQVLISKHILGVQPIPGPYNIIAADANGSGTVTTSDIVEIRKMILGLQDEFPGLPAWRFVEAAYQFPNPENPWEEVFPELLQFNNLTQDVLDADFTGIKVGDVNGSAGL